MEYKVNTDRETEIAILLFAAALQPEVFSPDWMMAMRVALLHEPVSPGSIRYGVRQAMRRYNLHTRALAVTTRAQLNGLREELLTNAVFRTLDDPMQVEHRLLLRLVGGLMGCEDEVKSMIAEAKVISISSLKHVRILFSSKPYMSTDSAHAISFNERGSNSWNITWKS